MPTAGMGVTASPNPAGGPRTFFLKAGAEDPQTVPCAPWGEADLQRARLKGARQDGRTVHSSESDS